MAESLLNTVAGVTSCDKYLSTLHDIILNISQTILLTFKRCIINLLTIK